MMLGSLNSLRNLLSFIFDHGLLVHSVNLLRIYVHDCFGYVIDHLVSAKNYF